MASQPAPPAVLFLTVGSGNPNRLEETLYTPISKSIDTGDWNRVVLLPSRDTLRYARELKRRHDHHDVRIWPLPDGISENDADGCYDHFQKVIAKLGTDDPASMAVDITRGTKAMSAALMLAAFRHRIPNIRYVEGDRDPQNPGIIVPGSERVRDIHADAATNHRTLDEARLLFQHGDFAAASYLLRRLPQSDDVQQIIRMADFYAAWDRLDYRTADETHVGQHAPSAWRQYVPSNEARQWVHHLAQPFPDPGDTDYYATMAARLRRLIVDLLANGRRRVRQRQFEDAVLRAYRALEMLGQARLFDHGLDSAALPADHEQVQQLQRELEKKGNVGFGTNKDETRNAGRELVARLLKRLNEPLAQELLDVGSKGALRIASRNQSVLIHGFEAVGPTDGNLLHELYNELQQLLRKDRSGFDADWKIARSLDFAESLDQRAL